MKIIITDQRIDTIDVTIETPHELRALYLLLSLISKPEFKLIRNAIASFDEVPALGNLCKYDISQNPVKLIYNHMTGTNEKKPTATQLAAMIRACKTAVKDYNNLLNAFYHSDIFNPRSDIRLPTNFLRKLSSKKKIFSKEEFLTDHDIRQRIATSELREAAYQEYTKYAELIDGFSSIDATRSVSILRILDEFEILSDEIQNDAYINDGTVNTSGITTSWYKYSDFHCSPAVFGSVCGIGAGIVVSNVKSFIDENLPIHPAEDDKYGNLIVTNTWNTFDAVGIMLFGRACSAWKTKRDNAYMDSAVEQLAKTIPAYERLLESKGYPYNAREIIDISSRARTASPGDASSDIAPLLVNDDRALNRV